MTNEEKDKQRLVLITARLDGRVIQKLGYDKDVWNNAKLSDSFDRPENYRIKPNDQVYIVMKVDQNNKIIEGVFKIEKDAIEYYDFLKHSNEYWLYRIVAHEVK